jgi:hypothetical protein
MQFPDIFIKLAKNRLTAVRRVWHIRMNVHSGKGFDYVKK